MLFLLIIKFCGLITGGYAIYELLSGGFIITTNELKEAIYAWIMTTIIGSIGCLWFYYILKTGFDFVKFIIS
jgi:hypothetical protein